MKKTFPNISLSNTKETCKESSFTAIESNADLLHKHTQNSCLKINNEIVLKSTYLYQYRHNYKN